MPFDFRDAALEVKKRDERFKSATLVSPCVTCTAIGEFANASGDPISAQVADEPDNLWVVAYGDSTPFIVLNQGAVASQTGLAVKVGYSEGSTQREILGYNRDMLPPEVTIQDLYNETDNNSSILRDKLATLRVVPVSGTFTVTVYGMEYNRFGARQPFPTATFDFTPYVPAPGKSRWALLYLDMFTMILSVELGPLGPDHPTYVLSKPNTPLFGFGTVYVSLSGAASELSESDLEDARRTLFPNKVSGVVYNRVVTELVIPADTTYIRGVLTVEANQVLRIEEGARVVVL